MDVKKINSIGNLKFIDNGKYDIDFKLKSQFNKSKICVSASTHEHEEIFSAKAHILLKKKHRNLITILIPRHVHRVNDIKNNLSLIEVTKHYKQHFYRISLPLFIVVDSVLNAL